jgi:polyisoprenoid-binding protein YceI
MKPFYIFSLLFLFSGILQAQKDSKITFVIKNVGVNVDGHFNAFEIAAIFDAGENLTAVNGYVEVSSIETGIESRDAHLLKADYFNVKDYPRITLKSKIINQKSPTYYELVADLSIKGIAKEITIPVKVTSAKNLRKVESDFEINRRDFEVGGGSFVLGKTVKIHVVYYQTIE